MENFREGSHGAGSLAAISTSFSSNLPLKPRRSFALLTSCLLGFEGLSRADVHAVVRLEPGDGTRRAVGDLVLLASHLPPPASRRLKAGGSFHGFEDVRIGAATAEIAGDGVPDLFPRGFRRSGGEVCRSPSVRSDRLVARAPGRKPPPPCLRHPQLEPRRHHRRRE